MKRKGGGSGWLDGCQSGGEYLIGVGTDDIDNGMVLPKKEVCAKNSKDGSFGGGGRGGLFGHRKVGSWLFWLFGCGKNECKKRWKEIRRVMGLFNNQRGSFGFWLLALFFALW